MNKLRVLLTLIDLCRTVPRVSAIEGIVDRYISYVECAPDVLKLRVSKMRIQPRITNSKRSSPHAHVDGDWDQFMGSYGARPCCQGLLPKGQLLLAFDFSQLLQLF